MEKINITTFQFWGLIIGFFLFTGSTFAQSTQDSSKTIALTERLDKRTVSQEANPSITLELDQVSLEEALKQIAGQAQAGLYYNAAFLPKKTVSLHLQAVPLDQALRSVLKGTKLKIVTSGRNITLRQKEEPVQMQRPVVNTQETITGTVTDAQSGETLPGVNVIVKGTTTGTSTDTDGAFELTVESLQDTLVFSFVGYQTQEVPINGQPEINVSLISQAITGEELVVMGYGTGMKRDVVSSISSIEPEDAIKVPTTDFSEMLRGKVPGIQVTSENAAPGSSSDILIRGQRSITGGNSPLIIVDGVPIDDINYINPSDVSSIEVLKDAAAQAIYGARASSGVILITTKKGEAGKTQLSYNGYYGTQWINPNFELFSGPEYVQLSREANRTINGGDYLPDEAIFSPSELESIANDQYINWRDEVLSPAPIQNHSISVSTGTEMTQVYSSFNFQGQNGVIPNSNYKEGSLRLNIDQTLTNSLKLGVNSSFRFVRRNNIPSGNILTRIVITPPLGQIYNDDGSLKTHPNGLQDAVNPLLDIYETDQGSDSRNDIINLYLDFNPLENLNYRMNVSRTSQNQEFLNYSTALSTSAIGTGRGSGNVGFQKMSEWQIENILSYNLNVSEHNLDFTFVQSASELNRFSSGLDVDNTSNDVLGIYGLRTAESYTPSIGASKRTLLSYMGRVKYDYSGKYYLTLSARSDGSSVFGANNRWGYFPAMAAGWNIHEEVFMNDSQSVNNLKLRVSYGSVGNQAIPPYGSLTTANQGDYLFGSSTATGYSPGSTLPNPNLKWETSTTFNMGLDFGLWNNRLSGTLEYYNTNTKDLLIDRLLDASLGYTDIKDNIGKVGNSGIELQLNSILVAQKDLFIQAGISFSRNRNEIKHLRGGMDDVANDWFIGHPINVYNQLNPIGIWQEGDDIENSWMPDANPGDIKIEDVNSDGEITSADEVITSQEPDWYGTFSYSMNYRNIDFSMDIYTLQGIIKENSYLNSYSFGGALRGDRNQIKVDYWLPENPDAKYPRPREGDNPNHIGTMGLRDASYVRMQNATLGYTLPSNLLSKINLTNIRIYATGHNLLTKTNYRSYDPEGNPGDYPRPVSVVGGVQIDF